jgi:hypothetical protein
VATGAGPPALRAGGYEVVGDYADAGRDDPPEPDAVAEGD